MKITPPNITPEPWHIGKRAGAEYGAIYGSKGEEIALPLGFFMDDAEARANTKAIAATPDTLAALALLVRSYSPPVRGSFKGVISPEIQQARAALIKAGYTTKD